LSGRIEFDAAGKFSKLDRHPELPVDCIGGCLKNFMEKIAVSGRAAVWQGIKALGN